jgi:methyl-accepting chemotaxis protein/ligand-binding sensor domain-containing protein
MRKMNPSRAALRGTLCIAIAFGGAFAQGVSLRFQHLTVENGLSQNYIRAILQDRRGFMWFATENGLNRYDGYSVRIYQHDPKDSTSISNNRLTSLYEDRRNRLWVASMNGYLNRFERETDRFKRYKLVSPAPGEIRDSEVWTAYQDSRGVLWVGTLAGLCRLDEKRDRFVDFGFAPGEPTGLNGVRVRSISESADGSLWFATESGLFRMDKDRRTMDRFQQDARNPQGLGTNILRVVIADSSGRIWIGTFGAGLNCFEPAAGRWHRYSFDPANPDGIGRDRIQSMSLDESLNELYLGLENGGLNVLDIKTRRFKRYLPELGDPASLNSNSVWSTYCGGNGSLWVGTFNGGVNLASPYLQRFTLYQPSVTGLNNPFILSLLEDSRGDLWIGTDGGGLNRLDRKTGRYAHFMHDEKNASSLCGDAVLTLFEDRDGALWIGTWAFGIDRFDRATGRFTHYRKRFMDWQRSGNQNNTHIGGDRGGNLFASSENSLHILDKSRDLFVPYEKHFRLDSPDSLNTYNMLCFREDRMGFFWMGGWHGLRRVNLKKRSFQNFKPDKTNPRSLSDINVFCIFEDSRGGIWIGTGGGISRFHPETSDFTAITMEQGLPSNRIQAMLEDAEGNLWISTSKGIAKWIDGVAHPEKPVFRIFDASDGLPGDEFKYGAAMKTRAGELFFGGQRGFVSFFPDRIRDNPVPPPVAITGFSIFNVPVQPGLKSSPLSKPISETDAVTLTYRQSVLTFEFSALNYILPQKNHYAYMLEGFEKNWNEVGTRRTATYTNLSPGRYVLRVKASNSDGIWNEKGVSLKIRVTPPFWKTAWFYLFCVLAAAAALYAFIKIRMRAVERHNRDLRSEVERRTAELRTRKDEIETAYGSMKHAVQSLNEGVETISRLSGSVADTSTRFDRTSRELAEGAAEQAGSIAEISSSLRELTVSASANAARALESEELTSRTRDVMADGMVKIKELSGLMKQVGRSSGEMEEVTKTIEEISALIRILSINASVEAARAGEAGAGFEVVAREVRELSARSEDAVKHTKRILHGVVERVNRSADLNRELTGRLKDVSQRVEKVSAAMADITSASSQQNIGINQISAGVEQVNKVIQMNTEFAKQTAETADGLSVNSEQLRDMVTIFTDAIHRLARQDSDPLEKSL